MFTVEDRVLVKQTPDQVFAFLADPRNIPSWRPEVLGVTGASGALSLGATFGELVNFMGKKTFEMKVTACEPGSRLVIEALTGPMRPVQSFQLTPADGGTLVALHIDVRSFGIFRLMEPLFPGMFRKLWRGYLANLQRALS